MPSAPPARVDWGLSPFFENRKSGVLLHPTSLPGPYGIGSLGAEARRFADFLADAGQRVWQILPLGPTGYGDSPYQCLSSFAGNHLLIDLDTLVQDGWLRPADLKDAPASPDTAVAFADVIAFRRPLLHEARRRFDATACAADRDERAAFEATHAGWLEDYALFMAVKDAHDQRAWTTWPADIAAREPRAMQDWRQRLRDEIETWRFSQFLFFRQWQALRTYCVDLGLALMGDVPIFVAHDSADVWANRPYFQLDPRGAPTVVAGVPPDYFSATGQLWGNPLYDWPALARDGYRWWIERLRATLALVDVVRLDHFRGFDAYWEIPGNATTAIEGRWVKGPGEALFAAMRDALGDLPLVAENLGVITPEVEALRVTFGLPGMAILQFAFGTDPQAPDFRPHNYTRDRVVFTGTHDNDTVMGWWTTHDAGHSTRSRDDITRERDFARQYLATDGHEMNWDCIRAVLASVANLAIVPMQDVLGLGTDARMNAPGRPTGNWRWRMAPGLATPALARRLRDLCTLYER